MEQLAYLSENLPELEFHIAAKTNISPYLASFNDYPNINLYTNIHQDDFIEDLLDRADIYLDINHWGEVDQIVQRAISKGKPVLAFSQTAHQPEENTLLFESDQPQQMADEIRKLLKEKSRT